MVDARRLRFSRFKTLERFHRAQEAEAEWSGYTTTLAEMRHGLIRIVGLDRMWNSGRRVGNVGP